MHNFPHNVTDDNFHLDVKRVSEGVGQRKCITSECCTLIGLQHPAQHDSSQTLSSPDPSLPMWKWVDSRDCYPGVANVLLPLKHKLFVG